MLLAKLVLVGGITLVFGMITTLGMFFVGQAILGAYGLPTASLADSDARWVAIGLGATMPFFPIVGVALGVLLRSTAGGITAVLGLLWLPQIVGEFMPMWARENIISLLPGAALDSLTIGQMLSRRDRTRPSPPPVLRPGSRQSSARRSSSCDGVTSHECTPSTLEPGARPALSRRRHSVGHMAAERGQAPQLRAGRPIRSSCGSAWRRRPSPVVRW